MKVSKLAMAAAISGLLWGARATAQQPTAENLHSATYEYGSYYAQEEPAPLPDEATAEPPSPSDMPEEEGAPAAADEGGVVQDSHSSQSCCEDSCCEDKCRPLDADPIKLFDGPCLECWGVDIGGWVSQGYTWNPDDPADRFNGPMTFNDRSNEYQLDQLYLYMDRPTDTGGSGWDLGGRVDLLYGDDYRFATALGLETDRATGAPKWDTSRFYGLAMPQLYGQIGYNDLVVKLGHFYTPVGYETVTATGNFFYSHLYTHQYGEPFTHTGGIGTFQFNDNWLLMGGIVRGWDNWEDTNDDASLLSGITWTSGDHSLAYTIVNGNEAPLGAPDNRNRYYQSVVWTWKVNDRLTVVHHSDLGYQDDAVATPGGALQDAEWYSLTSYYLFAINDRWDFGTRYESFRDDDGFRVAGLGTNPFTPGLGVTRGGFAGTFQDITIGLRYHWNANIMIRPEVRWDWYSGLDNAAGQRPYDDGTDSSQTTVGTDVIVTY